MKHLLSLLALSVFSLSVQATDIRARLGYNIGGITPVSLPNTIRHINSYNPGFGITAGVDVPFSLGKRWAVSFGLKLENLRMQTDATVKSYHTRITMDGETIEGYFTGRVRTRANIIYMTMPLLAEYQINDRWTLKAGPYLSFKADATFKGNVYNGHLRRETPTGDLVQIGNDNTASYDFSNEVARFGTGLTIAADYRISQKWGAYAELDWGLSDTFKKNFTAISFKMYAVHASFGAVYHF